MAEKKPKVLVIRFNSIGDIVLTSPVIATLEENNYEVHYITKKAYTSLLYNNPKVFKVWVFEDNFNILLPQLKKQGFDLVVDLHNNFRSKKVKKALSSQSLTFAKPRISLWLLTQFNIKPKKLNHIVDRFLEVIEPLSLKNKSTKLEFHFPPNFSYSGTDLPKEFYTIAVGAAFFTKQIPKAKILEIVDEIDLPVVLVGGPDDSNISNWITLNSRKEVIDLCGQLSIEESAFVIKKSICLLSGDTGMMHIGAALGVKMVNVFGSTHPILGYTPYYGLSENQAIIVENKELSCRPCTKQGKNICPKGHFKCMNDIKSEEIITKLKTII